MLYSDPSCFSAAVHAAQFCHAQQYLLLIRAVQHGEVHTLFLTLLG